MNATKMKNMIILKNLPSNIVEEAIIILKNNKKIKLVNKIEKQSSNSLEKQNNGEYILKEAEMIVGNYITKIEKEKQMKSYSMKQIENKYKRMKLFSIVLSIIFLINLILRII